MRRDERAQLNIIEAIMVGAIVFTAVAATAVFRLPTSPASFQQAELERIGADSLAALTAKVPEAYAADQRPKNCHVPSTEDCPYKSELERLVSLGLDYRNHAVAPVGPKTDPIADYFDQALPEGSFYVLYFSNGESEIALYPTFRRPPAADVVVAHATMGPAWQEQWTGFGKERFWLRPWETTEFTASGAVTSITDPLGRTKDQAGSLFTTAFGTLVPGPSPYGTYKLMPGDIYFAVVPPTLVGPGTPALRVNFTAPYAGELREYTSAWDVVKKDDAETYYIELGAANGALAVGDIRLTGYQGATKYYPPGSRFATGDEDSGFTLVEPAGDLVWCDDRAVDEVIEEGEAVYFDGTGAAKDVRLTRSGPFAMGSVVDGAHFDAPGSCTTGWESLTTPKLYFWDRDPDGAAPPNGALDAGEEIYLCEGTLASGNCPMVHLTPRGAVPARQLYDIRLVVWFGV